MSNAFWKCLCVWPLVLCSAGKIALPPGVKAGLYGDVISHSDFQLNLRPPEANTHDTETALDAIMKLEDEKLRASEDVFVLAKQRMLNIERKRISAIVKEGLAPLLEKLRRT